MNKHIAFLKECSLGRLAEVGGKAANLGELCRAGFPVPDGFCLTAGCYDAHLAENGLGEAIGKIAASIDFSRLDDMEKKTARIRELIVSAPVPARIGRLVAKAYAALEDKGGPALVAVRSSVGTRDLSRSSFPGQMDTFHNVRGADEVLSHVRRCWASVWTARAAGTRNAAKIPHHMVFIAPVVQRMVPAETAGVLFTANPQDASEDVCVINAAFGLGEAVVGGNLSPDHYVVCKETLDILEQKTGKKTFRIDLNTKTGQGNKKIALSGKQASKACLDPGKIKALAELGVAIEKHYQCPQDVEWAFSGQDLYVLQARRIAGIEKIREAQGPKEWVSEFDTKIKDPPDTFTSSNIGEVLPGVLTPLSQSILKGLDYGFWKANHDLGLVPDPFPEQDFEHYFLGVFYGRAHLNLSEFARMAKRVPGLSISEFDRPLPNDEAHGTDDLWEFSPGQIPFLLSVLAKSVRMRLFITRNLKKCIALVRKKLEESRDQDLSKQSLLSLIAMMESNQDIGREIGALHIANSQLAVVSYGLLCKLTAKWLGDATGAFASRLVTGLSVLESAKPSFEIHDLYKFVKSSPGLTRLFQKTNAQDLFARLRKEKSKDAKEFCGRMDNFLSRYGYRSVFEGELRTRSWEHDPAYVFSMIKNYLTAAHVEDPYEIESRQKKDRAAAMAEARAQLPFYKRLIFERVLAEAHTFVPGRENNKAILMMGIHEEKKILYAIASQLIEKGLLEKEDDMYFLTRRELADLCLGRPVDVAEKVPRRRKEYDRNQTVALPVTFAGRPKPVEEQAPSLPGSRVLKGLSVSPGRVTGPARVILDPTQDAHIESGEILVAPVTDASWTPLFLMARAIVVDVGGLLSHGSVVAREYGIPGVLNVLTGTKLIKTGQKITVDGAKGEVHIHEEGEPA